MSSDLEIEQSEDEESQTQQISVKCRAKRLVKLINNLNEAQRTAVRRIGFGGILELKFKNFPISSVRIFMDCFNDGSYIFRAPHNKEFMVTKYDVHDCFLLPIGPNPLNLVPTGQHQGSNSEENKELKDKWRKRFGVESAKGSIPLGRINKAIEADKDGGDDFCTLFVLMCMSSFLAPTSNNGVDFKLLRAAEKVREIHRSDWCGYVIDAMVSAGVDSKRNQTHVLGCIPFLMISYFQRFDYRGQICASDRPLIKHWDEARLKSRTKGELGDGGLGRQTWSHITYPPSIHGQTSIQLNVGGDPSIPTACKPKEESDDNSIKVPLPRGVEDDIQLKTRALDAVHELYLQIQRNGLAFHAWYVDATTKIRKLSAVQTPQDGFVPSQSTQNFWQSEELHRFCDKVESDAERLKQLVSKAPVPEKIQSTTENSNGVQETATQQLQDVLVDLNNNVLGEEVPQSNSTPAECKSLTELAVHESLGTTEEVCDLVYTEATRSRSRSKSSDTHRAPSTNKGIQSEQIIMGIEGDPSQATDFISDEIIESGALYNTAEINEVLFREQKEIPDSGTEEQPSNVTETVAHSDLQEAGYTASEVDAAFHLMEEMKGRVPEARAVHLGGQEDGQTKGVVSSGGNSRSTRSADKFPQTRTVHHPFDLRPVVPQSWTGEGSCKRRRTSATARATPHTAAAKLPVTEPLSPVSSRRRGRGDGLGCSFDCGQSTGVSLLVVSSFLRNNMTLFGKVKDWRKHVADYCFLDDGDLSTEYVIVEFGPNAHLQRNDVQTMLPNRFTSSTVIECWAMLMNVIESEENKIQKMAFFGLRHTDVLMRLMETPTQCTPSDSNFDTLYEEWDAYVEECGRTINLDSDMIFIPIRVGNHIACVCINFNSKTADILDNQSHTDPMKTDVFKASKIIVSAMSDYLDYKGIAKGCQITGFELRLIKFEWMRPTPNDEESGIFTMVHMLLYEGQPFSHEDLGSKISRRYLVLQLAAALVLADVNKIRPTVIEDVTRWVSHKESNLVTLKAKRRVVQILAKARSTK
ncbi:hypothetical protein RND81_07G131800 [Saponaria officinalis]|uniref:Ubiquitin-like protease family profile domain-containing protein n=1 Tax=Saponaria officinalis TaxID=3572 RepID=A0AAW1JS22_SAPOF